MFYYLIKYVDTEFMVEKNEEGLIGARDYNEATQKLDREYKAIGSIKLEKLNGLYKQEDVLNLFKGEKNV